MNVERKIFCFWTGENEMSTNRRACLNSIVAKSNCEVELVTSDNLGRFVLNHHPLHEAYEFLSYTHRSDYLRCYFMHHYGGGYADIKLIGCNWNPYFDRLESNEYLWGMGYREKSPAGVAGRPDAIVELRRNWKLLIGVNMYIFKRRTPFTSEWYYQMLKILDENLEALKRYPARHPQDRYRMKSENRWYRMLHIGRSRYPLAWAAILGQVFHPLCLKYTDRLSKVMPSPNFEVPWR